MPIRTPSEIRRPRVYLGDSPAEWIATNTATASLRSVTPRAEIHPLSRLSLWQTYHRPTTTDADGRLWDVISNAPMSTDHAIARFWVPYLCDYQGWALFTDGDVIFRQDVEILFTFARAGAPKAIYCVHHAPLPSIGYKKDYAIQQPYPRKNWSSVMLFNCGHPANRALDLAYLNRATGRELHAFEWLRDYQIGQLAPEWNYLVGLQPQPTNPAIVHFTAGLPTMPGHGDDPFADEWFQWARVAGYRDLVPGAPIGDAAAPQAEVG